MGSESQEKILTHANRQKKVLALMIMAFLIALTISPAFRASLTFQNDHHDDMLSTSSKMNGDSTAAATDPQPKLKGKEQTGVAAAAVPLQQQQQRVNQVSSSYQQKCNLKKNGTTTMLTDPQSSTYTTKPIWMPMLPFTIPDSLHKDIINPMTQTLHGAKSFYSSVRGKLRHCIGNGQSVTCLNVHPSVPMTKGMPDSKANEFSNKYIMILRNPMTALPSGYNAKAEKYGGLEGQLPQDEWRKVRDEWFDGMMDSWKQLVVTWKSTRYNLGMYLVYEDLFDFSTGVDTMKKIRLFLLQEGFQVVPEEELGCIWFHALGKDSLERFHRIRYDYDDYIPGFTQQQKDKMLKELRGLQQDFQDDMDLVKILDRYIQDIESHIKIDPVFQ